MHFGTKSYFKSNHNHTAKQTLTAIIIGSQNVTFLSINYLVLIMVESYNPTIFKFFFIINVDIQIIF